MSWNSTLVRDWQAARRASASKRREIRAYRQRAAMAVSRVNEIIRGLDPVVDGAMIYISNGYVDPSPSFTRPNGRVRLPIFALDPRLLPGAIVDKAGTNADGWKVYWTETRNSLRALSEHSGGFALAEGEGLISVLARINDFVRR